ncbi:hypothetical protein Q9233_012594 [Columba guinea]|nr:hypothetical protein Q9233_012594 [Columba guinea]
MAEESSDVPKELIESVRDVIGRKIKISVKKKVKLETKGDKVDNKILNIECYDISLKCVFMKMVGKSGEVVTLLVVSVGEMVAWSHGDQGSDFWESSG